jgi:hypothetical protein
MEEEENENSCSDARDYNFLYHSRKKIIMMSEREGFTKSYLNKKRICVWRLADKNPYGDVIIIIILWMNSLILEKIETSTLAWKAFSNLIKNHLLAYRQLKPLGELFCRTKGTWELFRNFNKMM